MHACIEILPAMRVCFVRNVGPYTDAGKAWEKLCSWAGQSGLMGPHTQFIGLCHDDPEVTPAAKLRYDACMTVDRAVQPDGEAGVQEIGGGEYATTRHVGPYETLVTTYGRLCGEWLPAHGREPAAGPCIEFYRNDPKSTPPGELVTDIYVPVEGSRKA